MVYRPKLMGKPLVLDISLLLRKIQDEIQAIFKTYPGSTNRTTDIFAHGTGAILGEPERGKREARLRAESWKAVATASTFRNWIR